MFLRLPPTYVSSTSTGPVNKPVSVANASRKRCAMNHADFCVMPRSRCSFMLDTPLRLVAHR
ncbi:MAG: hypothetical protein OXN97_04090 [Bryobacterales bacterium]|nr:hypothetical protein [Bryobacterales bacterium]